MPRDVSPLDQRFSDALEHGARKGHRRSLVATGALPGGRIERNGRTCIDLSSNDYLGLAHHPALAERAAEWAGKLGTGAGASRLVTGTSEAHLAIEAKVAAFKGSEAALLFASGWQANAAIIPALLAAAPGAAVFADRLVHASMHHGCAAAGAREIRFRHNDLGHLEDLLERYGRDAPARLILTESVFSMDGDTADLPRLAEIARRHDAFLLVDEAHATGVLGPNGAGLSAGIEGIGLVMGTFSKAMGSFGAYVCGSQLLCDYLVNRCGGFIYSTALPPPVLGAIDAALDLVPDLDDDRAHLASLADRLRRDLASLGADCGPSSSHIVPVIVGDAGRAVELSDALSEAGFLASAIRPPTVPEGSSRLRLALRADLTDEDIRMLIAALEPRL